MTPSRLRWGLILIQIGILILLVNIGVFNWNFTFDLTSAIPFLLILIGIEKIFTRSRLEFISYIAVIVLFFGGLYIAYRGSYGSADEGFFNETEYQEPYNPEVKTLRADLRIDDGDLTIRDATADMVYGRFSKWTTKPKIRYDVRGDEATVTMADRKQRIVGGIIRIDNDESSDWTLKFSREVPLDLQCTGDQSNIDLNLATTPLRALQLDARRSDVYVRLGSVEPFAHVRLGGKDSDLRLRLPTNVAVRFSGVDLASYMERLGLIDTDSGFVTPGYDTLSTKISVDFEDAFDNLKIEFY